MNGRAKAAFLLVSFLGLLLWSCASPPSTFRTHPQFADRMTEIKSVGLAPPDIKIYEVSAGGMRELRDDWCLAGKENVAGVLIENFQNSPLPLKWIEADSETGEELEEIQALFHAVSLSITWHTYGGPQVFPEKQKNFIYSLGPVDRILAKYGGDALLLIWGMDEISTGGRKVLMAIGVLTGALPAHIGGLTAVTAAVVDRSGDILWYNVRLNAGGFDLRQRDQTAGFFREVLRGCPGTPP